MPREDIPKESPAITERLKNLRIDPSEDTMGSLPQLRCWICLCDLSVDPKNAWVFRFCQVPNWDNRFINLCCHPCMRFHISPLESAISKHGIALHAWGLRGLARAKLSNRKDGPNLAEAGRILKEALGDKIYKRKQPKAKRENHEVVPDKPIKAQKSLKRKKKSKEKRTLALRFQVFKRDAYRCRLCGVSARDGEHVRLEVDHITPRSKGGTDDISNLWILCFACNRGKGASDL